MNDERQSETFIEFSAQLRLKAESVSMLERFREEFGFKTKSATISRILNELLCPDEQE